MKENKFNLKGVDIDFFEREEELEEVEVNDDSNEVVEEFLHLDYPISLFKDEDGAGPYWIAEYPDLPGCKSHGDTKEAAIKNLDEAKVSWMYSYADLGKEIPRPKDQAQLDDFSGKILLRIPKELHYKLTHKAKSDGVSLNQEILYLLAHALGEKQTGNSLEIMNAKLDKIQRDLTRTNRMNRNVKIHGIQDISEKYMNYKPLFGEYLETPVRNDRNKHKFKMDEMHSYFESSLFQ